RRAAPKARCSAKSASRRCCATRPATRRRCATCSWPRPRRTAGACRTTWRSSPGASFETKRAPRRRSARSAAARRRRAARRPSVRSTKRPRGEGRRVVLARRIVPCLDIKDGRVVKGVRLVELSAAGAPVALARRYEAEGADELVFLDITATVEGRRATLAVVRAVARELTIPFAVGGGVRGVEDVNDLLRAGCDKVSVNSAAVRDPQLIAAASRRFGAQCVIVA